MSNIKHNNKNSNKNSKQPQVTIQVVTKNFYASVFKKDTRMLSVIDSDKFHTLDAVMINIDKVKVFSSVLLNIANSKYTASKVAKEERPHYYICTLDAFMNCIYNKYNLSTEEAMSYKQQLKACYK